MIESRYISQNISISLYTLVSQKISVYKEGNSVSIGINGICLFELLLRSLASDSGMVMGWCVTTLPLPDVGTTANGKVANGGKPHLRPELQS